MFKLRGIILKKSKGHCPSVDCGVETELYL